MEILKPLEIGKFEVKNRFVMPPMCTYKSDDSAQVQPFHIMHYCARAIGGVGMIIVEATAVEERGRITNNDLGLWDDEQISSHKKLVEEIKRYASPIVGVQIAHAGRKSQCKDSQCVSCSPTTFSDDYQKATELSSDDIYKIIQKFIDSAKRAYESGYDFVEVHAAHGYLLHEFLSPLTNFRDDEFGGDFFSRSKILFEICKGIKKENIPFGVRISADEWEVGGFDINDSKVLSTWLEEFGAMYIHVSAGGNHPKPSLMPRIEPFYQCGYAKEIKNVVNIPVIAVGCISTANEGEALLKSDSCDLVAYGRELLRNPNLAQFTIAKYDPDNIESSYKDAFKKA